MLFYICKMNKSENTTHFAPKIMGILNLNSDSFYEGNRVLNSDKFKFMVHEMAEQKVDILDLGAMSSRPGSSQIPIQQEIDRLLPAIEWIKSQFPEIELSVDTFRADVCKVVLEAGVEIINDISGASWEPALLSLVAKHQAKLILMHLIGDFENMHNSFEYGDIVDIVKTDLRTKIYKAEDLGIKNIIVDPGFGFSKTFDQNWNLLQRLGELKSLNKEILVGVSRKRMIYQATGGTADTALIGSSIAHFIACQQGANILRVHDVQAARDTINIYKATLNSTANN